MTLGRESSLEQCQTAISLCSNHISLHLQGPFSTFGISSRVYTVHANLFWGHIYHSYKYGGP